MTLLIGVALYGALVALALFVHETGHVLAARAVGLRVNQIVVGIGPCLAWTTANGTRWQVGLFPVFGWVRYDAAGYKQLDAGRRVAVAAAGPAANFVSGGLLLLAHTGAMAEWDALSTLRNVVSDGGALVGFVTSSLAGSMLERALSIWTRVPAAPLGLFGLPLGDTMLMRALFWAGVMSMSMGLVNLLPLPPLDGQRIAAGTVEWVLGRNAARSVETVLLVVASSVLFAVIVFAP